MKILITGAKGFIARNLIETLKCIKEGKDKSFNIDFNIEEIYEYDRDSTIDDLITYTSKCDFVVHLAGINRPKDPKEFYEGNLGFLESLCKYLKLANNKCPILVSSSIQASKDNDYGISKRRGEEYLRAFSKENNNPIYIYRLANVFGKWCKPNYNSVVATWCYNIANNLAIKINDETAKIPLVYIDDIISDFIKAIDNKKVKEDIYYIKPIYEVSLKELANLLYEFKESRNNLRIIKQDEFTRKLYATYLSYLNPNDFKYPLKMNEDYRGSFTEFLKTKEFGQVSINISKPGITKGNHYHHTKNEKFLVVKGEGLISFRNIFNDEIVEVYVSDKKLEVVDIPSGYTHNIVNLSKDEDMITIMWANEEFNPLKPDTYFEEV